MHYLHRCVLSIEEGQCRPRYLVYANALKAPNKTGRLGGEDSARGNGHFFDFV